MRKPAGRNACLDQRRRLMVQPLLAALRAAFWQPGREPARKSRARAQSPVPAKKLAFEALEPRLLLAGDPGAAVLTIAGAIDVPGEQDLYQFTVEEPTRIVFDSLTNRGDLNWRLDGPAGLVSGRSFSATDSLAAASPVGELAPGSYELSVDGQDDALGAYELRVIDTASATAIVPGSPVSGVLDDGKQTAIYRFAARAETASSSISRISRRSLPVRFPRACSIPSAARREAASRPATVANALPCSTAVNTCCCSKAVSPTSKRSTTPSRCKRSRTATSLCASVS